MSGIFIFHEEDNFTSMITQLPATFQYSRLLTLFTNPLILEAHDYFKIIPNNKITIFVAKDPRNPKGVYIVFNEDFPLSFSKKLRSAQTVYNFHKQSNYCLFFDGASNSFNTDLDQLAKWSKTGKNSWKSK